MKKHGVLALVLAGVMLLLCGCRGMTTDDAKDYVQSALDCGYKAEVKKYAEITETTEKEAKKALEDAGLQLEFKKSEGEEKETMTIKITS